MPSTYQLFVKKHMLAMRDSDMKATDKMKHIAKLWQKSKGEPSSDDEEAPRPKPRKTATGKRNTAKGKKDIDLSALLQQGGNFATKYPDRVASIIQQYLQQQKDLKGGAIKALDWQGW